MLLSSVLVTTFSESVWRFFLKNMLHLPHLLLKSKVSFILYFLQYWQSFLTAFNRLTEFPTQAIKCQPYSKWFLSYFWTLVIYQSGLSKENRSHTSYFSRENLIFKNWLAAIEGLKKMKRGHWSHCRNPDLGAQRSDLWEPRSLEERSHRAWTTNTWGAVPWTAVTYLHEGSSSWLILEDCSFQRW